MSNQKPSFRFEINSLPVINDASLLISSPMFVYGGCQWFVYVNPKVNDHLSLYLSVANRTSLLTGWKRSANFYFVIFNQSEKELFRSSSVTNRLFCAESPTWGFSNVLPYSKIQEEGGKLIIEVYINVVEEGGDESEKKKNKTVDINGFQVLDSQISLVKKLFAEHPDIADDVKPVNEAVKTAYMNILLKLIQKLEKPPKSISESKLSRAGKKLNVLMDVGFKLDWLKLKLEEISLEKQKSDADESRVQQLERRVKNLELDKVLLEKKISDDADKFRVKQLEIRVKSIELMDLGYEVNSLKKKFDQVNLERKKSDEARAKELEQRVKDLELMELGLKLEFLKTKFDEASLERKKSDDADEARTQELEKRVKDLELMELGFTDALNGKLDQVFLEMEKSDDIVDEARVQQLEERVKDLEVMELGFKLNSLETKLDEVCLERKKSDDANEARAKQYEKHVKNLKMMELGFTDALNDRLDQVFLEMEKCYEARAKQLEKCLKAKLDVASMEKKKSNDVVEARAQELEKRVKDLEVMEFGSKLDSLKTNLDEIYIEMERSDETRAQQLEEERVKSIELMKLESKMESLKTELKEVSLEKKELELRVLKKIEEVCLERNITDYQDRSRVQQLQESVEFLLTIVSDLKLELDKKKNKSYDDGFMLVDELDH